MAGTGSAQWVMVTFPRRVDTGDTGITDAGASAGARRRSGDLAVRVGHTSRDTLIAISAAVKDLAERFAALRGAAPGG
jgi:hypothetical protein